MLGKSQVNEAKTCQGVKELRQNYVINSKTQVIGTGAFGKVYKTYRKKDKTSSVAIKVLDKVALQNSLEQIMREVQILNSVDHPNIVKYFETYDDKTNLFLVMEYIQGVELFEAITHANKKRFEEGKAKEYMRELFLAISHLHS